jgi:hypothetical protein
MSLSVSLSSLRSVLEVERECLDAYELVPRGGGKAIRHVVRPDAYARLADRQSGGILHLFLEL